MINQSLRCSKAYFSPLLQFSKLSCPRNACGYQDAVSSNFIFNLKTIYVGVLNIRKLSRWQYSQPEIIESVKLV
ncbi:hypothetical protein CISIN_1g046571mg [Citrus sinensis]|uniref:Uncharacterized protein n=1 Tax=Citrus sinensis TaxID=2711 RepID=A0A067H649_CITSI|nr:hypothetical protein CISIN_1g046571mg [Citrus sinensis]